MITNLLASPSAGAPALKYGDVNTVTPSPSEVKRLIIYNIIKYIFILLILVKRKNIYFLINFIKSLIKYNCD